MVLTSAVVGQDGLALTYRLTAADPKTMLTMPIGEIPPTGLLLKDGRIVATKTPAHAANPNGLPASGYPIGKKPYESSLSVDDACPGTTFQQVQEQPARYQAVVVMSPQNRGMPTDLKTPLVEVYGIPRSTR